MGGTAVTLIASTLLAGCAAMTQSPGAVTATAELRDPGGRKVATASLTEVSGGVRIVIEAAGLPPGPKGVHVHEVGDCASPAFQSAGGHFNPQHKQHGVLNPQGPHAGDLPNITIAGDGTGRLETLTQRITLQPGPSSVLDADGSAIVIHAGPDDFRTDPAGNSGARIACGIIVKQARPGA
jgi:Cu-Zn family superoxide dismutase